MFDKLFIGIRYGTYILIKLIINLETSNYN